MKSPFIPFVAFLFLLLLTIPFPFDFATSVVPGWHTTIFPPYFIWAFIVTIVLILVTIGYWLLSRRVDKINWTLFAFHFALTIPSVIFLKFPSIFLNTHLNNVDEVMGGISLRMKLIPATWTLFIIGQVFFAIYFIRTITAKQNVV